MKKINVLGIDLAKEIFQLHGVNSKGDVIIKKKVTRKNLLKFVIKEQPNQIFMEACGGANYWARSFQAAGFKTKLISPQFVKPFVKTNKNDAADAEAIVEAGLRPSMRFVAKKEVWQQEVLNFHKVRKRLVRNRTALSNEIRGLLLEYGITFRAGMSTLRKELPLVLDFKGNELTDLLRALFKQLLEELYEIDERISYYEARLKKFATNNKDCKRIQQVEGIGLLSSTALVAAMGDPKEFKNGRQFAAWLGLVPKQHSTGGKTRLLGISKRGDCYLRGLLIHGGRAAITRTAKKKDKRNIWALEKWKTRGFNKACVAYANKNARIVWALISKQEDYKIAV